MGTSKAERHLGDDGAGYGETDQERPVPAPFTAEENGPRIELPHLFLSRYLLRCALVPLSLSLSPIKIGKGLID